MRRALGLAAMPGAATAELATGVDAVDAEITACCPPGAGAATGTATVDVRLYSWMATEEAGTLAVAAGCGAATGAVAAGVPDPVALADGAVAPMAGPLPAGSALAVA